MKNLYLSVSCLALGAVFLAPGFGGSADAAERSVQAQARMSAVAVEKNRIPDVAKEVSPALSEPEVTAEEQAAVDKLLALAFMQEHINEVIEFVVSGKAVNGVVPLREIDDSAPDVEIVVDSVIGVDAVDADDTAIDEPQAISDGPTLNITRFERYYTDGDIDRIFRRGDDSDDDEGGSTFPDVEDDLPDLDGSDDPLFPDDGPFGDFDGDGDNDCYRLLEVDGNKAIDVVFDAGDGLVGIGFCFEF